MAKKQKHFYGWYLVAALWLIYFFNIGFPMYGGTVLNSYMVDQLGISRTVLGLGFSLFSLCQGLPGPLISRMIERRGQRFTMGAGTLMIAASAILMAWAVRSAAAFLVFTLLYTPCVAAIATVKKETNGRTAAKLVVSQCVVAWVVAFCIRAVGLAFGLA